MAGILSRTGAKLLTRPALNGLAQRSPVLDSLRSATASPSTRSFASDAHGHGGVTYAGLTLHKPARWHVLWGTGMSALMWFWVLFRAYHDGDTFLHGHAVHFEHEGHTGEHDEQH